MEAVKNLEIYIPKEAEVKNIYLHCLPKAVLKHIGLVLPDSEASTNQEDAPKGIWISRVEVRTKGKSPAFYAEDGATENMSSMLVAHYRSKSGPVQMSFRCSNRVAYKALKNMKCASRMLPKSSAPLPHQEAVIIHHGQIYLSMRSQRKKKRRKSKADLQSPYPSTSCSLPKRQRKSDGDTGRTDQNIRSSEAEPGTAAATPPHFDFNVLEEEERIAQMRARLRQSIMCVENNLSP